MEKIKGNLSCQNQGIPYLPICNTTCSYSYFEWEEEKQGTEKDELLKFFIRKVNLDAFWASETSTIYGSYIHFRKKLLSWKKVGIDLKIALPVFGTLPMKCYVCGYSVAINTASK